MTSHQLDMLLDDLSFAEYNGGGEMFTEPLNYERDLSTLEPDTDHYSSTDVSDQIDVGESDIHLGFQKPEQMWLNEPGQKKVLNEAYGPKGSKCMILPKKTLSTRAKKNKGIKKSKAFPKHQRQVV